MTNVINIKKMIDLPCLINNFVSHVKDKIASLAQDEINKQLSNEAKKRSLDIAAENYVYSLLNYIHANFILRWAVKKYLIPQIPIITQAIYDLIRDKVNGVTKENG